MSASYWERSAARIRNYGPLRRLTEAQALALHIRWAEAVRDPSAWKADQLDVVSRGLNRTPAEILKCWQIRTREELLFDRGLYNYGKRLNITPDNIDELEKFYAEGAPE